MIQDLSINDIAVLQAVKYLPAVSIILPFEPKMTLQKELEYRLERVAEQVEKELNLNYVEEKAGPVMSKLRQLIKNLNFSTYKKSIAIFVSPLVEKVFYLDIPVEEKVVIDESFEIRDLVYSKKDIHKYLVLVLGSERSQLFLGNTSRFFRLVTNTPRHFAVCRHEPPERVSNFSDPSSLREVMLEKFLHCVDISLGVILNGFQLPLFVMASERVMGHFKQITRYANRITGYVHGSFSDASEREIRDAIGPYVEDWKKVKEDNLLLRLDAARSAGKLAIGIREVWKEADEKRGKLLIVEKNYICPADYGGAQELIVPHDEDGNHPFYIKDAVDDVIEKVLENGGDVEFVDEGLLCGYQHIALIQYY